MTKKKPSPQNRIWEKERRERLNKTFEDLHRLLPDHEPSSTLTKVEILQRAIELIGKLQKKVKELMQECSDPLKEQIHEQEERLKRLLGRNEELVELCHKAKVSVPPCKYTTAEEERRQQCTEEKENGDQGKKSETKRSRSGAAARKQSVINRKHSKPPLTSSTVGSDALALSTVNSVSISSNAVSTAVGNSDPIGANALAAAGSSALKHINGIGIGSGHGVNVTPALLSTPIMTTSVLISNNGNLVQMPFVAPPSSLLIVGSEDVRAKINLKNRPLGNATSGRAGKVKRGKFLIKSIDVIPGRIVNGKIPIPPLRRLNTNDSSMKGVKASKLKRKKTSAGGKRSRKIMVESTAESKLLDATGATASKRSKLEETTSADANEMSSSENHVAQSAQKDTSVREEERATLLTAAAKTIAKANESLEQPSNPSNHLQEGSSLEHIHLNHADLSEDIFANLEVPGDHATTNGGHDDGSLSPTAAYLMNFPLVAGGGKAAGNHIEAGDVDECENAVEPVGGLQATKKDAGSSSEGVLSGPGAGTETGSNMMLDNFSSFFNYGQMETMAGSAQLSVVQEEAIVQSSLPSSSSSSGATITAIAAAPTSSMRDVGYTNYNTIYQSIDNMLEHRSVPNNRPTMGAPAPIAPVTSESDYAASVAFTFTLTSGTSTAPTATTSQSLSSNHFFGASCGALATNPMPKPVADDFSSPLKPSIEFTFSLTSTSASAQYTNSAILATTMTTPSYDTYGGYYHKPVPQTVANYCPTFGVLDPLLTTEKPATSFTFSLTSSTKTEPSYTQSSLPAAVTAQTAEAYETATAKHSTKQSQTAASHCYTQKSGAQKLEKVSHIRSQIGSGVQALSSIGTASLSTDVDGQTNGLLHQPIASIQPQQQIATSSIATVGGNSSSVSHHHSQTHRYDVSWMAAGTQSDGPIHHSHLQQQHQQQQPHQQHQHQHQHQQQQPYELAAPPQIIPSLEFPVPAGSGCYSASYKSDIFFAHPPGDEHNLTWSSPSKLANILNDSSSPYFPPVTLPSLNGDLALNTSIGTGGTGSSGASTGYKMSSSKKGHVHTASTGGGVGGTPGGDGAPGSSFLSVSQLVNQPSKSSSTFHGNGYVSSNAVQQKPLNNNYSAEALIGNQGNVSSNQNPVALVSHPCHEPARKDKLFEYGCSSIMESGFSSSAAVPSSTGLAFNFDTYGTPPGVDYNKGYNFATQSNTYVPAFASDGSGGGGAYAVAGAGGAASSGSGGVTGVASCTGAPGATGLPYYPKSATQSSYYQQSSNGSSSTGTGYSQVAPSTAATVGQDFNPYYLPTFGDKISTTKPYSGNATAPAASSVGRMKKNHKTTGTAPTGGYSYPSLSNTTPASSSSGAVLVSGYSVSQVEATPQHPYPNYHQQQRLQQQQSHQQSHLEQHQRSQHHHGYHVGSTIADVASVLTTSSQSSHKTSSSATCAYSYRQYSSSSGGFAMEKASKPSTQHHERSHHEHLHQTSFHPPVPSSNLQSHAQLDLSSAHNPSVHATQPTLAGHMVSQSGEGIANYGAPGRPSQLNAAAHHQHHHQHQLDRHEPTNGSTGHAPSSTIAHAMGHGGSTSVPPTGSGSCGTITNFNLSTICPEINDKTGHTREDSRIPGVPPVVPLSVASIMTHW